MYRKQGIKEYVGINGNKWGQKMNRTKNKNKRKKKKKTQRRY